MYKRRRQIPVNTVERCVPSDLRQRNLLLGKVSFRQATHTNSHAYTSVSLHRAHRHQADVMKSPIDAAYDLPCLRHSFQQIVAVPWLDECFTSKHVPVFPKPNSRLSYPVKLL